MRREPRTAWALAALAFALVTIASYAIQRLIAAGTAGPSAALVIATAHTPFTWRLFLAILHGVIVGALVATSFDEARATAWLSRSPWLIAGVVVPAALAMVWVP